jgi:hypothetical protein
VPLLSLGAVVHFTIPHGAESNSCKTWTLALPRLRLT